MIQALINSKEVVEFCKKIKEHNLNTSAKVCGVDYSSSNTAFKLYIELMEVPTEACIKTFLSEQMATNFIQHSQHWDPSKKSSLAFGIKIDTTSNVRSYYHVKFKNPYTFDVESSQLMYLKLLGININNLEKGISLECDSNQTLVFKHYYYVVDKSHIAKILSYKKFNITDIDEIRELEIYATKNKHKINIINVDKNFEVKSNVWENIPDIYKQQVKQDSHVLQSQPAYVGKTSDDIVSVYYSLTNKSNNILNI